jgi:hypothetical protein
MGVILALEGVEHLQDTRLWLPLPHSPKHSKNAKVELNTTALTTVARTAFQPAESDT